MSKRMIIVPFNRAARVGYIYHVSRDVIKKGIPYDRDLARSLSTIEQTIISWPMCFTVTKSIVL